MTDIDTPRCGYVAIVGRPNVGKSTLLNHILGQKLAITSRKPQTTRHNMLGIKTEGNVQAIYVDTPGLHKKSDKALNRYMNRSASAALKDVDVVVFVVDRDRWTEEEVAESHFRSDSGFRTYKAKARRGRPPAAREVKALAFMPDPAAPGSSSIRSPTDRGSRRPRCRSARPVPA